MKETQWERAEDCPEDALEQARQQEDALFAQALEKQQRKAEAPYSDIIVTQCMLCVGLCLGVLIWNYFAPEAALRCAKWTGADGLMIGRSCFGDPWIFQQVEAALAAGVCLASGCVESGSSSALVLQRCGRCSV